MVQPDAREDVVDLKAEMGRSQQDNRKRNKIIIGAVAATVIAAVCIGVPVGITQANKSSSVACTPITGCETVSCMPQGSVCSACSEGMYLNANTCKSDCNGAMAGSQCHTDLQAALDAAVASGSPNVVLSGSTTLTQPLVVNGNVNIKAANGTRPVVTVSPAAGASMDAAMVVANGHSISLTGFDMQLAPEAGPASAIRTTGPDSLLGSTEATEMTLQDMAFTNFRQNKPGSAVYVYDPKSVSIKNSTFTNCTCTDPEGACGAVAFDHINSGATVDIDATFTQNQAKAGKGGAVYVQKEVSGNLMLNGNFSNNAAARGSVLWATTVGPTGSISLNGTYNANTAAHGVVAMETHQGSLAFPGIFTNNIGTTGAVFRPTMVGNTSNTVFSGTFSGNQAQRLNISIAPNQDATDKEANGGVFFSLYGSAGRIELSGNFTNNIAGDRGGVVALPTLSDEGQLLVSGMFDGNKAAVAGGVVDVKDMTGGTVVMAGNFSNNFATNANTAVYRVVTNKACINQAGAIAQPVTLSTTTCAN